MGFGRSPASGSSSNSSASSHMSAVEKRSGLSCTPGSSRHEMTPRPSGAVRSEVARWRTAARRRTRSRRRSRARRASRSSTPTVADESPPIPSSSALPASELRNVSSARRSARSTSGEAVGVGVVEDELQRLLLRLVGAEHLRQQRGPEVRHRRAHGDARRRGRRGRGTRPGTRSASTPGRAPVARSAAFEAGSPGWASPERSPLTSATNDGTPAAESCSARSCSVFVLPVPVAPATRPWRLAIASGTWTTAPGWSLPSCTPRPRSSAAPWTR